MGFRGGNGAVRRRLDDFGRLRHPAKALYRDYHFVSNGAGTGALVVGSVRHGGRRVRAAHDGLRHLDPRLGKHRPNRTRRHRLELALADDC